MVFVKKTLNLWGPVREYNDHHFSISLRYFRLFILNISQQRRMETAELRSYIGGDCLCFSYALPRSPATHEKGKTLKNIPRAGQTQTSEVGQACGNILAQHICVRCLPGPLAISRFTCSRVLPHPTGPSEQRTPGRVLFPGLWPWLLFSQ